MRSVANDSGCSIEFPALCQHIRGYEDMARGNKRGHFPNWKPIVPNSTAGKEDIWCLAELLPGCLCDPAFP